MWDQLRAPLTEFVGTLFLVLVITTAGAVKAPLAPLAIGGVLAAMVFAGGHISGAHYNPAVTVAVWLRGRLSPVRAAQYVVVQLLGGLAGVGLASVVTGGLPDGGKPLAAPTLQILAAELLFTFALAYVVLNVATSKSHPDNSFYGLAIGLTVTVGAVVVGPITGGAFNPAVVLAGALSHSLAWGSIGTYLVATLLGGAAAAGVFRFVNPTDR
ncbi:porin [Streptomyces sp. 150FB]|nr:porin [Streptomyces sp. 150FB]